MRFLGSHERDLLIFGFWFRLRRHGPVRSASASCPRTCGWLRLSSAADPASKTRWPNLVYFSVLTQCTAVRTSASGRAPRCSAFGRSQPVGDAPHSASTCCHLECTATGTFAGTQWPCPSRPSAPESCQFSGSTRPPLFCSGLAEMTPSISGSTAAICRSCSVPGTEWR